MNYYHQQIHNLDEMVLFLETHKLPKLSRIYKKYEQTYNWITNQKPPNKEKYKITWLHW